MDFLRAAVIGAAAFGAAGSTLLVRRARAFGEPPAVAPPRGSAARGVRYALGRGLLPWEKESTRRHLASYMGGYIYHAGIFAAFATLASATLRLAVPRGLAAGLRIASGCGLAAGLGLLIKRRATPLLRAMSRPEDYALNLLIDAFLAAAAATASADGGPAVALRIVGIAILIDLPLGKLRHCVFFFRSRARFGRLFGRRSVLPPGPAAG